MPNHKGDRSQDRNEVRRQYDKFANEQRSYRGPSESDWERESKSRNQPDFHSSERRTPYGSFHGSSYSAFYEKSQNPAPSSEGRNYLRDNNLPEDISRHYSGLGPRTFKRSDERVREEICIRLTEDPHIDAHDIEVLVMDGYVTLSGTVPEKRMKRMSEELVEQIHDVKDISNRIKVFKEPDEKRNPG